MAAPVRKKGTGQGIIQGIRGCNEYTHQQINPQHHICQQSLEFGRFPPVQSSFPHQIDRFSCPSFTPPTSFKQPEPTRSVSGQQRPFFPSDVPKPTRCNHGKEIDKSSMKHEMAFSYLLGSGGPPPGYQNIPPPLIHQMFTSNARPTLPHVKPAQIPFKTVEQETTRPVISLPYPNNRHQPPTYLHCPPPDFSNNMLHGIGDEFAVKVQAEQLQVATKRIEDVKWVKEWMQKKMTKSNLVHKPDITVSETQEKTRHMIVLLARLQKGKQSLESMKNEKKSIWEQKLKEVLQIKNELDSLHNELINEDTVSSLKRSVSKTRKKRERSKRRKIMEFQRKEEELDHREEVHAHIDKNMQQVIERERLKKQEEDMKNEADQILGQVRKKLSDANKAIQLLSGLQKLRSLRKDRLTRQGILNIYEMQGESSTKCVFERKISNMTELLHTQLKTYKSEEETLQVDRLLAFSFVVKMLGELEYDQIQ